MPAFDPVLNIADLNGDNGFRINGAPYDSLGWSVSGAGDVNGDGFDDLFIGSHNGSGSTLAGLSYVVFGSAAGFPATLDVTALDGSNGFKIEGEVRGPGEGVEMSVSDAGDVNGDGIGDIIIGLPHETPAGESSGSSYVVFGSASGFTDVLSLTTLDGTNGFRIDGVVFRGLSGFAVSGAGDVNGDGFDDVMVGALGADPVGYNSGSTYVVFGGNTGFAPSISVASLNGSNGFRIDGFATSQYTGGAVSSAGDINGDGFDDMIIGNSRSHFGDTFIVFGAGSFSSTLSLSSLNGNNGFRVHSAPVDFAGYSVSGAGDVNGDGIDDLIIGATHKDQGTIYAAGASYVVFGTTSGFSSVLDVSTLDGSNGFRINGTAAYDRVGFSVSGAGDINGDGFDDLVVGAPFTNLNGSYSGSTYVVFGAASFGATLELSSLDGDTGFRLDGDANFFNGFSVSGAGDINGDGFADLVSGAPGGNGPGAAFVVLGGEGSGSGPSIIIGTAGDDVLIGTAGADSINGLQGSDTLQGLAGDDTLIGGNGSDTLDGGVYNDRLNGGNGSDTLLGGDGDDTLNSGEGSDTLKGGEGSDKLRGGDGDDTLQGGKGRDTLQGGKGDDSLTGGAGKDVFTGGSGADHFIFTPGDFPVGTPFDTITDFNHSQGDKIVLSAIDAIDGGADNAFSFIGSGSFSGVAGQLHYVVGTGRVTVEGDTNGDSVADFSITVLGVSSLVAGDFTL
jgi:Ca2+-binding RTX toxin-like protein